jgi:hypothetical protein
LPLVFDDIAVRTPLSIRRIERHAGLRSRQCPSGSFAEWAMLGSYGFGQAKAAGQIFGKCHCAIAVEAFRRQSAE